MVPGLVITGAWVSLTVTLKFGVVDWPAASVAVKLTVVAPPAKLLPLAGLAVTGMNRSNRVLSIASLSTSMKLNHR